MSDFKANLIQTANDNKSVQRRRFPRRNNDVCMVNVDGHPFPVVDWSLCGVLFEGDDRLFSAGQTVQMVLRFKVNDTIEDVKIIGEIVRKNARYVATQFKQIPSKVEQALHRVIDSNPDNQSETAKV